MFEMFDLRDFVNAGAGICALYLGLQVKAMLAALKTEVRDIRKDQVALEIRVEALELLSREAREPRPAQLH
jgi:hypothetical protein